LVGAQRRDTRTTELRHDLLYLRGRGRSRVRIRVRIMIKVRVMVMALPRLDLGLKKARVEEAS